MGLAVSLLIMTRATLKADEVVEFFPTFATKSADGHYWNINLHGWVYRPEGDSVARKALLYLFGRRLGVSDELENSKLFRARARPFLVDNEGGRSLTVQLAGESFLIGPSKANGHIVATVRVPVSKLAESADQEKLGVAKVIRGTVILPGHPLDGKKFQIQLIEPEGISVISDIDDTIKISEVLDKRKLLLNTFAREFEAVPMIAEVYRKWESQGAVFHYVSASPWQLHSAITLFLGQANFPLGSLALKTFRWKDRSFFNLFKKGDRVKGLYIRKILESFPKRQFILVGDSSERDPELYLSLALYYPAQIRKILIRDCTAEGRSSERWSQLGTQLPKEKWQVFVAAEELQDLSA